MTTWWPPEETNFTLSRCQFAQLQTLFADLYPIIYPNKLFSNTDFETYQIGCLLTETWSINLAKQSRMPTSVGNSIKLSQNDSKSSGWSDQSTLWPELKNVKSSLASFNRIQCRNKSDLIQNSTILVSYWKFCSKNFSF